MYARQCRDGRRRGGEAERVIKAGEGGNKVSRGPISLPDAGERMSMWTMGLVGCCPGYDKRGEMWWKEGWFFSPVVGSDAMLSRMLRVGMDEMKR